MALCVHGKEPCRVCGTRFVLVLRSHEVTDWIYNHGPWTHTCPRCNAVQRGELSESEAREVQQQFEAEGREWVHQDVRVFSPSYTRQEMQRERSFECTNTYSNACCLVRESVQSVRPCPFGLGNRSEALKG